MLGFHWVRSGHSGIALQDGAMPLPVHDEPVHRYPITYQLTALGCSPPLATRTLL